MHEFIPLGKHCYCVEGDVLFIRYAGELTLPELQGLFAVADGIRGEHGWVLLLNDGTQGALLTPDARRFAIDHAQGGEGSTAVAVFGASFARRVAGDLIHRAARLIGRSRAQLAFVTTEADARAFLEHCRELFRAARPPSPRAPDR